MILIYKWLKYILVLAISLFHLEGIASEPAKEELRDSIPRSPSIFKSPELEKLFENVTFTPLPKSVEFHHSVSVKSGGIQIHYRDLDHLNKLIRKTPNIQARPIYFVLDKETKDSEEFRAIEGTIKKGKYIHILAAQPLKLSGKINQLFYGMVLPKGSDFNNLSFSGNNLGVYTGLKSYEDALNFIKVMKGFDQTLFNIRTSDAKTLITNRKKDYEKSPNAYPSLPALCLGAFYSSDDKNPLIFSKDYIASSSTLIYRASSIEEMKKLKHDLPDFHQAILSIDSSLSTSGVYSKDPLYLDRGFVVKTEGNLLTAGIWQLSNYNLKIKNPKHWWNFGSIYTKNLCGVTDNFSNLIFMPGMEKPASMPAEVWAPFVIWWYAH